MFRNVIMTYPKQQPLIWFTHIITWYCENMDSDTVQAKLRRIIALLYVKVSRFCLAFIKNYHERAEMYEQN